MGTAEPRAFHVGQPWPRFTRAEFTPVHLYLHERCHKQTMVCRDPGTAKSRPRLLIAGISIASMRATDSVPRINVVSVNIRDSRLIKIMDAWSDHEYPA